MFGGGGCSEVGLLTDDGNGGSEPLTRVKVSSTSCLYFINSDDDESHHSHFVLPKSDRDFVRKGIAYVCRDVYKPPSTLVSLLLSSLY